MAVQERRSSQLAPAGWQPLQDFEQVAERMQRLLDQTFGGDSPPLAEVASWVPPVDIEETDDAYVVEAEIPGIKRDDVNIEFVGNELTITGEIKERERVGLVRRRTRRTGSFEYHVTFPNHVDGDKIEAQLDKGVLTVRVPKAERAQRRKIAVNS
jgi:HSP20 family protein